MSTKTRTSVPVEMITAAHARAILPRRDASVHKWSVGGVLIVGGAPGYIGAPALCAMGAGRSGAGIVRVVVARSSITAIASLVPEATFVPLPDGDSAQNARRSAELIQEASAQCRALIIGPGLSQDDQATALLRALFGWNGVQGTRGVLGFSVAATAANGSGDDPPPIVGQEKIAVVDADALNWLAEQGDWWNRVEPHSLLLTPHSGEMARLTSLDATAIDQAPESVASEYAARWQQTVVLKAGKGFASDGDVVLTTDQYRPGLATAGSGDVLSGSIGAFLAQGLKPLDAAALALFAGNRAAERLQADFGVLGMVAGDLPVGIARSLAELEASEGSPA